MAPELFEAWENEGLPSKTTASDCYALGQVILEVTYVILGQPRRADMTMICRC